jgi:membrane protease YdiL (CAAX protease family)
MPPVWGRRAAYYAATCGLLLAGTTIAALLRRAPAEPAPAPPHFVLLSAAVPLVAALAIASYVAHPHPGLRWRDILGVRTGPRGSAALLACGLLAGVALAVPVQHLFALSQSILERLGFPSDPQPALLWMADPATPRATLAALAAAAVLLAPLAEEILYRALLFGGLAAQGRPVRAAVLSSLFFAALHASVPLVLPLLALALALCLLRRRWGLPASLGAHMGFNAANAALALFLSR